MTGNSLVALALTIRNAINELDREEDAANRVQLRQSLFAAAGNVEREAGRRLVDEVKAKALDERVGG